MRTARMGRCRLSFVEVKNPVIMKFLSFHGSFLIPFDCLHYSMILSKSQQNIFLIFQQKS